MQHLYSHFIVIFIGLSFIGGSLFGDFANNQGILTGAALSATFFAGYDLLNETEKKNSNILSYLKQMFLFLGIFSIIVLPHVTLLIKFFSSDVNELTLITLGIVIMLMGLRHFKLETNVWKKLDQNTNEVNSIIKRIENKIDAEDKKHEK
jgi:Kef-type K+ transport system membrane component KefB